MASRDVEITELERQLKAAKQKLKDLEQGGDIVVCKQRVVGAFYDMYYSVIRLEKIISEKLRNDEELGYGYSSDEEHDEYTLGGTIDNMLLESRLLWYAVEEYEKELDRENGKKPRSTSSPSDPTSISD
jgi:hypothetical protein